MRAAWPVLLLALASPALAEGPIRPAEAPPPDYAGQQYVDSRGCLFLRAGQPGNDSWIPRVSRQGMPLCGNPPSGRRAAAAEAGGDAVTEARPQPADAAAPIVAGYYVAVGSFGVTANAESALGRVRAMDYPVARARLSPDARLETVLAGPFGAPEVAERVRAELRGKGFADAVVILRRP